MLIKKLFRTMWQYKAQFVSMIIMIAIGIGIFVGFNMEWVSIEKNTDAFFEETGLADYRIMTENGFSAADLAAVEGIDGVTKAGRYLSVNADVKREGEKDSIALTVTENPEVSHFLVASGAEYDETDEKGIWLSEKYASANEIKTGDSFSVTYGALNLNLTVRGLVRAGEYLVCVRDSSQLMPDYKTFGFGYISPAAYKAAMPMGAVVYPQINVISDLDKTEFKDAVKSALGKTVLVLSKDESSAYSLAHGEVEEGQTMGGIMPVLFLAIAVLTMVTTMHRLAAKEKTQIGTLKALGFRDKRILVHYTSYATAVGIIGSAIGIGLGFGVSRFIWNPNGTMGTYFDLPTWNLYVPWFCWVVIVGIIALLTLIGFLSVKQMLRGTAADALRPYAPKKVKKLLIERTKLWNKFSFGTKWNMRDVMRHKSRTIMSLIGTLGCMVLIVGAFGAKGTMTAYLNNYYEKAMNYSSRIYVSEKATDEERDNLVTEYDGDWSGSVSVELNEKAYSLDVYGVTRDLVRFTDEGGKSVTLGSDGAYICRRISDAFGLKAGDTFTVSPYGSDKTYTLEVAAVLTSVAENIAVTPEYAEKIGIEYKKDSVYTATEKENVAASDAINNIVSKSDIMKSFDTFLEIMNMMVAVFIIAAVVLGIVVLYNLGVMSYTERYREMATLKVVGFKDRRIGGLLIGQNMWVTLIGVILGFPLGFGALKYLYSALASEYEVTAVLGLTTWIVSPLITFGVSILVSLLVARKNKKIDMVEALKGAE